MQVSVIRKEHFNAAHRLYNPKWSKEKNEEVFGPCANEYYHGHNFELIVTVKGEPDPETGFVVDLKRLAEVIKKEVTDKLEHKNINIDVDFMSGKLASCENLIYEISYLSESAREKILEKAPRTNFNSWVPNFIYILFFCTIVCSFMWFGIIEYAQVEKGISANSSFKYLLSLLTS